MSDDGGREAALCLDCVQSEISIQDGAMAGNIEITFISQGSQYANKLERTHLMVHLQKAVQVEIHND